MVKTKIKRQKIKKRKSPLRLLALPLLFAVVFFFLDVAGLGKTSYGLPQITYKQLTARQTQAVMDSLSDQPVQVQKAATFCLDHLGDEYSQRLRFAEGYSDCSSLVYRAFMSGGVDISNDDMTYARAIYQGLENKTVEVQDAKQLQPGDIIFYADDETDRYKGIYHVALYMGDGMMCDATMSIGCVAFRPVKLYDRWYVVRLNY